jgi:peptidoglycan/xylan/chitin deacetylase (PgdA/CDA1 family)
MPVRQQEGAPLAWSPPIERTAESKEGLDRFDGPLTAFLYERLAFPLLRPFSRVNPTVVYYHTVADCELAHLENLYSFRNIAQFKRDLDVLLKYFRPVSLQDFLACRRGEKKLPRNSFLLTFDDGLRECHEIAGPILKQKGIPATFFLCSAFVDNRDAAYDLKKSLLAKELGKATLSRGQENQIRAILQRVGIYETEISRGALRVDYRRRAVLDEIAKELNFDFSQWVKDMRPYMNNEQCFDLLKAGHALGAHSVDHPRYCELSLEEQLQQTRESVDFVRNRFGLEYAAFSFPGSDAKVSVEFFRRAREEWRVDVFFGNRGFLGDPVLGSVQRSSMEKTSMSAEGVLGKALVTRLAKKVIGRGKVPRGAVSKIQAVRQSCV